MIMCAEVHVKAPTLPAGLTSWKPQRGGLFDGVRPASTASSSRVIGNPTVSGAVESTFESFSENRMKI